MFGVGTFATTDGPEEISFFEAVLAPAAAGEQGPSNDDMPPVPERGPGRRRSEVEQQLLPIDDVVLEALPEFDPMSDAEHTAHVEPPEGPAAAPEPGRRASPYAENL